MQEHVPSELFVHLEHVDAIALEDGAEGVVADDLLLVLRILHVVCLDVVPEPLDDLWSRELLDAEKGGERFTLRESTLNVRG